VLALWFTNHDFNCILEHVVVGFVGANVGDHATTVELNWFETTLIMAGERYVWRISP